ncbi:restriction endonuclease subunit S [Staphylococcus hominis]|uniref:restriction endonuclease subunit S n=1 Tax=Staphylococcus hominis TaxID=1290 RepID=UPI003EBE0BA7
MTKHTNAPALRFPEFRDEWNQNKLSDVVNVYDGTHQTPKYTNEGIKFLSVENIKTLNSDKYISKEDFIKEFKIHPEYGDILMTRIGDIGTPNIVNLKEPLAYYVSLALLKPININSYFLNSLILSPTVQNELWRKTLHIAFPKKINKNEIAKVLINYPTFNEQEKIGYFFSKLDRQIELEEKKLELLEQQKREYMQKIFSQELRFKNEDGIQFEEWSFQSLSKIFDLITDYVANGSFADIRKNVSYSEKEDYAYVIRLQDASSNWKGPFVYTNKHAYEFLSKTKLFSKDIIMSNVGTVGKTFRVPNLDKPMTLGPNSLLLRSSNNDMDFLYFYLNSSIFKKTLLKIITPGVQAKVNKTDLKTLILSIPSKEEQKKIGTFFNALDKNIEIQGNKVNFLKQRKQGLLQKMFI